MLGCSHEGGGHLAGTPDNNCRVSLPGAPRLQWGCQSMGWVGDDARWGPGGEGRAQRGRVGSAEGAPILQQGWEAGGEQGVEAGHTLGEGI